jgi:hypothetical protein
MKALLQAARGATPYLLVEVLLPGGTMIALLIWALRHKEQLRARGNALRAQGRRLIGRITGLAPAGAVTASGSLAGNVASKA